MNIELYKKYGPIVLKEHIEVLDRLRLNILADIDKER